MKKLGLLLVCSSALLLSSPSFASALPKLPSLSVFKSVKLLPAGKLPLPSKTIKYDFTTYPKVAAKYFTTTGKDYFAEGTTILKSELGGGKVKITSLIKK